MPITVQAVKSTVMVFIDTAFLLRFHHVSRNSQSTEEQVAIEIKIGSHGYSNLTLLVSNGIAQDPVYIGIRKKADYI
jgi:hypothetical protein